MTFKQLPVTLTEAVTAIPDIAALSNVVDPLSGELRYVESETSLYLYDGAAWNIVGGLQNIVEDTTPQLGGDLDVNGFDIIDSVNGRIDLNATKVQANNFTGNWVTDPDFSAKGNIEFESNGEFIVQSTVDPTDFPYYDIYMDGGSGRSTELLMAMTPTVSEVSLYTTKTGSSSRLDLRADPSGQEFADLKSGAGSLHISPTSTYIQADSELDVQTLNNSDANSTATKSVTIKSGNKDAGTGNSGAISIQTGNSAGGTRGNIILNANQVSVSSTLNMNSNNVENVTDPTNSQDAATKNYVDGLVANLDWQESVLDTTLTTPPGSPSLGDRYLIPTGATGAWSANVDDVAEWNGSSWEFTTPDTNTTVADDNTGIYYRWNNTAWVNLSASIAHNSTLNKQGGSGSDFYHSNQPINTTDDVTFNSVATPLISSDTNIGFDLTGNSDRMDIGATSVTMKASSAINSLVLENTGTGASRVNIRGNNYSRLDFETPTSVGGFFYYNHSSRDFQFWKTDAPGPNVNIMTLDNTGTLNVLDGFTTTGASDLGALQVDSLNIEDNDFVANFGGDDASAEGGGILVQRTGDQGAINYEDALESHWKIGKTGDLQEVVTVGHTQTLSNKDFDSSFGVSGSTSGELTVAVPAVVTSHTLTWPAAQGGASTVLKNDGSGNLSWGTITAGISAVVDDTDPDLGGDLNLSGFKVVDGTTNMLFYLSSISAAFGGGAGDASATGSGNTGFGKDASATLSNGTNNTAFGFRAGQNLGGGDRNTIVGSFAGDTISSGSNNTAIGQNALGTTNSVDDNTGIGRNAGLVNAFGAQNTYLGSGADTTGNNFNNATAVGYNAKVDASNKMRFGNDSVTAVEFPPSATVGVDTLTASGDVEATRVFSLEGSGTGLNSGAPSGTIFTPTAGSLWLCIAFTTGGTGLGSRATAMIGQYSTTPVITDLHTPSNLAWANDGSGNIRITTTVGSDQSYVYSIIKMR